MKKSKKYFVLFFVFNPGSVQGGSCLQHNGGFVRTDRKSWHTNDGHGRAAEGTFGIKRRRPLSAKTWKQKGAAVPSAGCREIRSTDCPLPPWTKAKAWPV